MDKSEVRAFKIMFLILAAIMLLSFSRAFGVEYSFAPNQPASFKKIVRKTLSERAETWIETKPVKFWLPGPLTFQSVRSAFISPSPWKPMTFGEVYRNGNVAAWVYRGSRDFITINTGIRTSKSDMASDLNYEIDFWRIAK